MRLKGIGHLYLLFSFGLRANSEISDIVPFFTCTLPKYKNSLCMKESSIVNGWSIELWKRKKTTFWRVFRFLFYDDQWNKIKKGQFPNIFSLINLQILFDDFNILLLLILFDYSDFRFRWANVIVWVWANVCLDVWERFIIIINELIGCVL